MKALMAGIALIVGLAAAPVHADPAALAGSWKGPWYIGMSSGMATMELAADGSGTLALTNMEEFGDQPVAISKQSFDGQVLRFSAVGPNGGALTVALQAENEGRKLRGNGKYGGFGARLELRKLD
jgi:hypothetical protein